MNNQKCDTCGQFGEVEDVVVTIKKHKACDINGAFGRPKLDLPRVYPDIDRTIAPPLPIRIPNSDMELINQVNKENATNEHTR